MGGSSSFPRISIPRDRVYVVTGGNTGLGYESAKWIAMMGGHVIIACRSEERAKQAIENMKKDFAAHKEKGTRGILEDGDINVEFMPLDLASLSSVMSFVEAFKAAGHKLHVLVCNAGLAGAKQTYTEDDNELHFQVNYLGHVLLQIKLYPIMLSSGEDLRIINVSSLAHEYTSWDLENIQGKKFNENNFDRWRYYNNSKAYQVMGMYAMARKLGKTDVTINSVHPGFVRTELNRNFPPGCLTCIVKCLWCTHLAKDVYSGSEVITDVAVNPALQGQSCGYYVDLKLKQTAAFTRNEEYQEQLWKFTLERLEKYVTQQDLSIFTSEKA